LVLVGLASSATAQYKVLSTTKVGGEGGFDYVKADADGRKLYVARSGPTGKLYIYNLDTLAPVGTVETGSAHGVAIDTATRHGFATSKSVTMFDTETLAVIKTIATGGSPDGSIDDAAMKRVYILSHSAPNLTALDTTTGEIVGTLELGGAPEEAALDGKGRMYVDLEDKDAIAVVDTATLKVVGRYDVSSKGGGCAGLAMDVAHDVLFATCRDKSKMIIVSAKDGKILDALPIGVGSDGAGFNPETGEAFSSQGDGTLTVVKELSPTSFTVEQTVKTAPRAKTMTLDTRTGKIFLPTAEFGPAPAPATPGAKPGRAPMVPGTFAIVTVGR
jgi:DNA-binding beta-propeller fold protein YncE